MGTRGAVADPSVTAAPCQLPLRRGAFGGRIATASVRTGFAMTWIFAWGAVVVRPVIDVLNLQ